MRRSRLRIGVGAGIRALLASALAVSCVATQIDGARAATAPSVQATLALGSTTPLTGQGFTVTAGYACASTTLDCVGAVLTVAVPTGLSTPTSVIGTTHVASSAFDATNRVERFTFVSPLPAGSSGEVSFVTSFPQGASGNGQTATLTATITTTNVGSATAPAVTATASASSSWGAALYTSAIGALDVASSYTWYVRDLLASSSTGRSNLLGYTLNVKYPAGTTFVSATSGGTWTAATTTVTWTVAGLAVGSGSSAPTVTAVVKYPSTACASGTSVTITASGTGTVPGPTGTKTIALTSASTTHAVTAAKPAITVTKTIQTASVAPATSVHYYVTARNSGNVPETFSIQDVFPDGMGIGPGGAIGVGLTTPGTAVAIYFSTAANPRTTPVWTRLGTATTTYTGGSSGVATTAPNPLPNGATRITALRWDYTTAVAIGQTVAVDVYPTFSGLTDAGTAVATGTVMANCAVGSATYASTTASSSGCVNGTAVAGRETATATMVQSGGSVAPGQTTAWTATTTNTGNVPLSMTSTVVLPDGMRIAPGGKIGIGYTQGRAVTVYYSTSANPRATPVWVKLGVYTGSSSTSSLTTTTAPATLPGGATGITALQYVLSSYIDPGYSFIVANYLQFVGKYDDGSTVPTGAAISNCQTTQYSFTAAPSTVTACQSVTVPAPYLALQASNYLSDGTGANPGSYPMANLGSTVTLPLSVTNTTNSWLALVDPVLTEVVPAAVTPSGATWAASIGTVSAPGLTFVAANDVTFSSLTGGRTAVRLQFHGSLAVGTTLTAPLAYKVGQSVAGTNVDQVLWVGGALVGTPTCNSPAVNSGVGVATDAENVMRLGSTAVGCTAQWGHRASAVAAVGATLYVKGSYDTTYSKYPNKGTTVAGGPADYQLNVANSGTVSLKSLVVVDVLPSVGDGAVLSPGTLRGSQFSPSLAGAVTTTDPAIKVYYSTATNPCRPEVGVTTSCTAPNWISVVPSNPTVVKSLKLDFTSIVMSPGQSIQFNWPMRVPSGTPTALTAWNSVGYSVTRSDTNTALLPSEPMMTGLSVLPPQPNFVGDRVWSDANNDGIQGAKEGGINGVKVRLYRASDDSLVASTITAKDYAGKAGYFTFANLPDDTYYLVFDPTSIPYGSSFSPYQKGSDPTLDSDADPTTGRTPNFVLAGKISDWTRDAGVYVPQCDTITC